MIFSVDTSRWQTVIADLSLILFLVAASALDDQPKPASATRAASVAAPPRPASETADISLTVWSTGAGSPPLAAWLAEQAPDESQRLAISITYAKGDFDRALATAASLRRDSGAAGERARITIAEGAHTSALVSLVQDAPPAPHRP